MIFNGDIAKQFVPFVSCVCVYIYISLSQKEPRGVPVFVLLVLSIFFHIFI